MLRTIKSPRSDTRTAPLKALMLIDGMDSIAAGGTERQFLQLARIAKKNGVRPSVAVLRGTEWLTEEIAGCPVEHFNLKTIKTPAGIRELVRLFSWIRGEKFDVLQTFFWDANMVGPFLGKLAGIPVVVGTRRCLSDPDRVHRSITRWLYPVRNAMVDSVIANSHAVRQSVLEVEGFSRSKVDVVYNGLELDSLRVCRAEGEDVRRELRIRQDDLLVGNISGLRKVKGLETFLQAASLARAVAENLRFVIVGEGEMRPVLESLIDTYGLEDSVVLVGAQNDVRPYLAAMDIAVLCSKAEGMSNSLLEYMAAGLPIIATDIGGNREAIEGEAGILVLPGSPRELADAVLSLRDPGMRAEMGRRACKAAERFDIKVAESTMATHFHNYANKIRMRRGDLNLANAGL